MKIGIVGATGLVGRTILQVLEERRIIPAELRLFSSKRSAGTVLPFNNRDYQVEELTEKGVCERFDYLLFSAGKEVSMSFAPLAEETGNCIIDNSSAFRKTRPLVVPEINSYLLQDYQGIIANPNCSTIQLLLALYPLDRLFGLKRLIVSTYQSISGAGNSAIEQLLNERLAKIKGGQPVEEFIDLNLIPAIGDIDSAGRCQEELKMHYEIKKILGLGELEVAVTTVRVPVIYGHSESVFAEFQRDIDLNMIADAWKQASLIRFSENEIISPRRTEGSDLSYVCRLRKGVSSKSILFWNAADNIRVGAASNAVNIMQKMIENT